MFLSNTDFILTTIVLQNKNSLLWNSTLKVTAYQIFWTNIDKESQIH
jgi:hypothetical protein